MRIVQEDNQAEFDREIYPKLRGKALGVYKAYPAYTAIRDALLELSEENRDAFFSFDEGLQASILSLVPTILMEGRGKNKNMMSVKDPLFNRKAVLKGINIALELGEEHCRSVLSPTPDKAHEVQLKLWEVENSFYVKVHRPNFDDFAQDALEKAVEEYLSGDLLVSVADEEAANFTARVYRSASLGSVASYSTFPKDVSSDAAAARLSRSSSSSSSEAKSLLAPALAPKQLGCWESSGLKSALARIIPDSSSAWPVVATVAFGFFAGVGFSVMSKQGNHATVLSVILGSFAGLIFTKPLNYLARKTIMPCAEGGDCLFLGMGMQLFSRKKNRVVDEKVVTSQEPEAKQVKC